MRCVAALLVLAGVVAAVPSTSPLENRIRIRAEKFYQLLAGKKFRESEELVAPEDRDTYYAMEKPQITDFKIKAIHVAKGATTAELEMESTTRVRRPMVGDFQIPLSYRSHWKLEKGIWYWYLPADESHDTPFGPMHFTKNPASAPAPSEADIRNKINNGVDLTSLTHAVKADKTVITLGKTVGETATVALHNTLNGTVRIAPDPIKDLGFAVRVVPSQVAAGQTATLTLTRVAGGPPEAQFSILVVPTQEKLTFTVKQ